MVAVLESASENVGSAEELGGEIVTDDGGIVVGAGFFKELAVFESEFSGLMRSALVATTLMD